MPTADQVLARALDGALDLAVVPGYSALGYRLRRRFWAPEPKLSLEHHRVLVTGASSGIGEAICEQLARRGAVVHMLARDPDRGARARERVAVRLGIDAGVDVAERLQLELCDLADLGAVRDFAGRFAGSVDELTGLVHNAGVLTSARERSVDGHELTFATGVLAPFLLTRLLGPALRRARAATVVFVSSAGMYTARLTPDDLELDRREFDGPRFYAHAKRAQVVLAELLAERFEGGTTAFASMHPGWVDTPGLRDSLPRFHQLTRPILRDPGQGADTATWLIGAGDAAKRAGEFWHDRRPRPKHLLPWTREAPADRDQLWSELIRITAPYELPGTTQ